MNRTRMFAFMLVGAAMLPWQSANAVGAAGAGRQATPSAPNPPFQAHPPESPASMNQGTVTALSAQGDHVEIQGRAHFIAAGRTRFYRDGQAVTVEALKKGQTLRFTLAPGSEKRPVLGVVHVP